MVTVRNNLTSLLIKTRLLSSLRFLRNLKFYYLSNRPRQISWAITGLCNSKCIFCEAHEQLSNQKDISTDRVFSLIDEISSTGIRSLLLVGGEVFIRKDIFKILEYIKVKGLRVQVITNSLTIPLLSSEKIEIIKKCVDEISFSLDSTDTEQYDFIRGIPGAFSKVMQSIKLLADARVKQHITTVIYSGNMKQIPDLIRFASELGIRSVHFQLISPATIFENTKAKEGKLQLLPKDEKELDMMDRYILEGIERSKKHQINTNLKFLKLYARTYFQNYLGTGNGKEFFMDSLLKHHRCLSVFTNNFIDYDGSFKLCPLLPALGNVKEEGLQGLLSKGMKFKGVFKKGTIPLKFCKNCFCSADINLEFSCFLFPFQNRRLLWHMH